jgi:tetratricopeptide (TPR) repeat protein
MQCARFSLGLVAAVALAAANADAQPTARFDDAPPAEAKPRATSEPVAPPAAPTSSRRESWATAAARELSTRAESSWRRGDTGNALRLYTEAVRMDSSFGPAYIGLGRLREALRDDGEAARVYTLATRVPGSRAEAFERRAVLEQRLGESRKAFVDLQTAVDLEPANITRRQQLGTWYVENRAWVAALSVWRRLVVELERAPDSADALSRARLQVRALTVLASDLDPVTGPGAADRSWVRQALAAIAERAP